VSAPDPWSEPARFYRYAARRQARGLATLPPPHDHRIPQERHVEMLRLRLVEGLTLDEVGERTGVTGGRVQQLLRDYFGLRVRKLGGVVPSGGSGVRVPSRFVEVLREIVECGYGAGIVTALREWQDLERQIARWSGDPKQNQVARQNIRRIEAFMLSAGVDDRSVVSVALPSEAVALVRLGSLGELGDAALEISEAIGRTGYDQAAKWYAETLKRQDAVRALLNAIGWENVEEPRPVTVYLDVHRDALARAMHNGLDDQRTRAMHPDTPEEERTTAEANCALLEKLLAAIGGQTRRPGNTGSA
jgi:hypothetical protein